MLRSVQPQFSENVALEGTSFLPKTFVTKEKNQILITFGRRSAECSRTGCSSALCPSGAVAPLSLTASPHAIDACFFRSRCRGLVCATLPVLLNCAHRASGKNSGLHAPHSMTVLQIDHTFNADSASSVSTSSGVPAAELPSGKKGAKLAQKSRANFYSPF